jgi:hypothetical protein
MAKRKAPEFEKILELSDELFGSIEDLPADEVARFLADAGKNTAGLKRRLYEHAEAISGGY